MQIVDDFIKQSYNNKGKTWKSSRILRVMPERFFLGDFAFLTFFIIFFFSFSSFFSSTFFSFFQVFNFSCFSFYLFFFHLFLFHFVVFHFFISFHVLSFSQFFFSIRRQTQKNRRSVPIENMTMSFCENSIFGSRSTGRKVRDGPFEGGPAFIFFIFFHFLFFRGTKSFSCFLFSCLFSNTYRCWH